MGEEPFPEDTTPFPHTYIYTLKLFLELFARLFPGCDKVCTQLC